MKKILAASDFHVGSNWGLWPDNFQAEDPRTGDMDEWMMNPTQSRLWKMYQFMIQKAKDVDIIILNGDLCDGPQRKAWGKGTKTPDLNVQAKACEALINLLPDVPKYFTQGSEYHSMNDRPIEQYLAERTGGIFGDDLCIDECGIRIYARHFIPVSKSAWMYRCYSDDTEVLTQEGWKLHTGVKDHEKIAIYDPLLNNILFEEPENLLVEPYSGPMYNFTNRGSNILVTPSHKMWVQFWSGTRTKWGPRFAEDIKGRIDTLICAPIKNSSVVGLDVIFPKEETEFNGHPPANFNKPINILDWCEFLGYYLSEGGRQKEPGRKKYRFTISQKSEENVNKIRSCLDRIGHPYNELKSTDGVTRWSFGWKQFWKVLAPFGSDSSDKKIPREIFQLPREALEKLFFAMLLGDGSIDPRTGKYDTYYTSSKRLADDFQELATLLGYPARVALHYYPKKENHNQMWRVYIKSTKIAALTPKIIQYTGNVVCFTVSTGLYLTRRRGKYPTIQGNSTPVARDLMLLALSSTPEHYGHVDLAVFSHAHYKCGVILGGQTGIITPCFQARTPFAVKVGITTPPDIGFCIIEVEEGPEGRQHVNPKFYSQKIGKPCKIVGREAKCQK